MCRKINGLPIRQKAEIATRRETDLADADAGLFDFHSWDARSMSAIVTGLFEHSWEHLQPLASGLMQAPLHKQLHGNNAPSSKRPYLWPTHRKNFLSRMGWAEVMHGKNPMKFNR